jgi:hypothetical protein
LGRLPGGDRSHPKEVFYWSDGAAGSWRVRFEVFDVQAGEVSLWVNWHLVKELRPTQASSWSGPRRVVLPDQWFMNGRRNYIHFVAAGDHPNWSRWGVRKVTLTRVAP